MAMTAAQPADLTDAPGDIGPEEWQTRLDLAACYRLVHHHGWTAQVYNHITARVPGGEKRCQTPFSTDIYQVSSVN